MTEPLEQGSEAWRLARVGCVTASRIADIIARTKMGYSASRANYAAELIVERLTGTPQDGGYLNAAMQWGIDHEADARAAYEFHADVDVAPGGFVLHPRIPMAGASPDGLVGADGLVEIKCPLTATHLDTLEGRTVPNKYIVQMQWQMACADRHWCDFVSFDPRLPQHLRLFVARIHRDAGIVADLEREAIAFLAEIEGRLARLPKAPAPYNPVTDPAFIAAGGLNMLAG